MKNAKMHEMYLLKTIFAKKISFIPQKFVYSKLGPPKSITTVGNVHPK